MKLLISGPEERARTVELGNSRLRLGRAKDNELPFPQDAMLSRYHLAFEPKNGSWFIVDCGSRNGTVLNSQALTEERQLRPGDRIFAGQLTIEIQEEVPTGPVRFVSQDPSGLFEGTSTFITTLEEVLKHSRSGSPNKTAAIGGRRTVDALIKAGQELAGRRPLNELFETILDLALEAVNARRGIILVCEGGHLIDRATRGKDFTISTAVRDQVLKSKRSLIVNDTFNEEAFRTQRSIVTQQVRSLLTVPLQTGSEVIGLIYVDNWADPRVFSQEDLELLTVMANVAAIRIEHARLALIEEQDKITQAELAQATDIQRSLLPAEAPPLEGYRLAAYNVPCRAVGGDYYDFLTYDPERMALVIADVCGKGMPAALMMSSLQARVQMLAASCPDAAQALTSLNRNLAPRFPPGRFITAFYAILEMATGRLEYSNAGHNYPIVVRADGSFEQLVQGGLVLALVCGTKYSAFETELRPGDLLCLYSDGVTEATNSRGEMFSEDRLARFVAERKDQQPAQIVKELLANLHQWSSGPLSDDLTLVLVARSRSDQTSAE
jgi:phosphoserine phosphatase RsbU/P